MIASSSCRVLRRWTLPTLFLLIAGACGDEGLGPDVDRDPAGQPPAAPTGLQLTALGPTEVRLAWQDNAADEDGFRVYRGTATDDRTLIETEEANVGAWSDTGLTPMTTYRYRVVAFNDHGESAEATASTTTPALGDRPAGDVAHRVLVDASKDGGVWWYPQAGPFDPSASHQGKPLADYLRGLGYVVTEMGRGERMTDSLALAHGIIIRANRFSPAYTEAEISAYRGFLARATTLVLLSDHQTYTDGKDEVADLIGVGFVGRSGDEAVTTLGDHPITQGVGALQYLVGAYAVARDTSAVEFLGWLADGRPVMGISTATAAKVFFLGDTNLLELLPQPLLENLVRWGF